MKNYLLSVLFLLISVTGVAQNVIVKPELIDDIVIFENDTLKGDFLENFNDRFLFKTDDEEHYWIEKARVKQLYLKDGVKYGKKGTRGGKNLISGGQQIVAGNLLMLLGAGIGTAIILAGDRDTFAGLAVIGVGAGFGLVLNISGAAQIVKAGRKIDAVEY